MGKGKTNKRNGEWKIYEQNLQRKFFNEGQNEINWNYD